MDPVRPSARLAGDPPNADGTAPWEGRVRIWSEDVLLPTYKVGEPSPHPMFLEKRVYQGSSGRTYPYPVIDRIFDERRDELHPALFLENRYLKVMVLPGFGGRIQYAYDKTNAYPFIYHNHVIKPALVGLAGPWLSGGIEFNWPQHHRPGTYCPVDWTIRANHDGSQTLWLSETEPMWHLKGTLGLSLYPDRAVLEIQIRLHNPTPLPQTFHLWTNTAVQVNEHYQSVFPPDVRAVYDHGKRDVSSFPIARGEYYKVDYSKGVDISWYKNIPVPTSFMAAGSEYDFLGGYDHGRGAGVLHVADHHAVPGKKQWVWGAGDFGRTWDRNLTDDDGPYAELMCGVFADNQPDFSWLHPHEEKQARQFFLPYKAIGYVRNATEHGAISLDIADGKAALGVYATGRHPGAHARLWAGPRLLWERQADLGPEAPLLAEVALPRSVRPSQLRVEVLSGTLLLVGYSVPPADDVGIPEPARAIPLPAALENAEALYLAGLHLEQYRHATREPEDYYREALRRDSADVRSNNALGRLLLRRGQIAKAEPFFRTAIESGNRHNANPYDGEPYYNLGLCLRVQGRAAEARSAFHKAAWNSAWQAAAFFQLAQLAALDGEPAVALAFVERSLARQAHNQKAAHLHALLLRRLGRLAAAGQGVADALERDPLDFGAGNERVTLLRAAGETSLADAAGVELFKLMRGAAHSHLELAADYAGAGAYDEAIELLSRVASHENELAPAPGHVGVVGLPNSRPMVFYALGYYASLKGDAQSARRHWRRAAREPMARFFPNGLECLLPLRAALADNPRDAGAAYALGNLWYDQRQTEEAIGAWEQARRADGALPTVHRNLALAYYNKRRDPQRARRSLARAVALDPRDPRLLFELDLLKKRLGASPEERLRFLRRRLDVVVQREDLLVEYATLLNTAGAHQEALRILLGQRFHPWEGGEGKVTRQYVVALVRLAQEALDRHDPRLASNLLQRALDLPESLGEGKLPGGGDNELKYWLGVAHEALGERDEAQAAWEQASCGLAEPTLAVYYNDQDPAAIFFQGRARRALGDLRGARQRFNTLVRFGRGYLGHAVEIDYFAVSLPEFLVFDDDLAQRHEVNCRYLIALGSWGLGTLRQARKELTRVLRLDPSHQAACLDLSSMEKAR